MISLINVYFGDKSTDYFNFKRAKYPNPGLVYLCGFLEKKNIEYEVIDAKFYDLDRQEIIKRLERSQPRIVGLTSTTTEIDTVHNLIKEIRQVLPEVFILLGGIHASALPQETLEANEALDAVIKGEGEFALLTLARSKNIGDVLGNINGLYYRKEDRIHVNEHQIYGKEILNYGRAAFHKWCTADKYHVHTYRGCPFSCSFCFRVLGKKVRGRHVSDIIYELEWIAINAGEAELAIVDGTFGLFRSHTEELLNEIIRRGLNKKLKWSCSTRVDIIDKDLMILMKKAGCTTLSFGIESGSNRILKSTGKNISVQRCLEAVKEAKSVGLETTGYYILGHVGETRQEVAQTVDLAWRMNCDNISIGIMVPWPGTKIFELAEKNQGGYRMLDRDFSRFDKYFGNIMAFPNLGLNYLEMMRIKAYLFLYLRNFRWYELALFLWRSRAQGIKKIKRLMGM